MKERTARIIGYLQKTTRLWVLLLAIIVCLMVGYMLRGAFSSTADRQAAASGHENTAHLWTCSMHPQIRLPKPGNCPICGMKLIPLVLNKTEPISLRELAVSKDAEALMNIQTMPVERKFVEANVRMVGKIDYDETLIKYITAWVPGRLDRLFVDYTGVPVKDGDHMVSMYSPDLLSAQEELLQALETVKNLKESDSDIIRETSEATLAAVRDKLRLWGLRPEQIAEIEKRGTASDHVTIYAPIGGIVIHKNVQEGMYVTTGTKIYTIADLSKVWVRLDAYESDLMWLRYGQQVEFTTEAYPGERFVGTIAFIDPTLTQTTRTVKVRVNADNSRMMLKPGMFVRAVVKAEVASGGKVMSEALAGKWICPMHPGVIKDSAGDCDICDMPLVRTETLGYLGVDVKKADKPLVIPASSALVTGTRAIVYVKVPDQQTPTFVGRQIVLGPRAGDYYIVRHGLSEGELVVTRGNFKIDAELQIQASPSMMTPEGGGSDMNVELPPVTAMQLQAVFAAGGKVNDAVTAGDFDAAISAFAALQGKVEAVKTDNLQDRTRLLWGEYSMFLTNDAVEGKDAKSMESVKQTAKLMNEHLASMKSKFSLDREEKSPTPAPVNSEFRKQFTGVAQKYLAMQESLAGDDFKNASDAAREMNEAVVAVDMELLQGDDHMAWMKTSGELKKILADAAKAEDIESLRKQFALLSEETAVAAKRFGPLGISLYQFKCPMAFNNRGATWLQTDDKTHNPYFGATMPGCGEVIQILPGDEKKGDSDE